MTDNTTDEVQLQLKGWLYDRDAWGGDWWRVFHGVLFRMPEKLDDSDKVRVRAFVSMMPAFLPCGTCSVSLVKELTELPLTDTVLMKGEDVVRWGLELHNAVNRRIHKPEITWEDLHAFYFLDVRHDVRRADRPCTGPNTPWHEYIWATQQLHARDTQHSSKHMWGAVLTGAACALIAVGAVRRS